MRRRTASFAGRAACLALGAVVALSGLGPAGAQEAEGFGRDDRWVQGTDPASCDAVVASGPQSHIYVTCGCGGVPAGILFTIDGAPAGSGRIELAFDDAAPESVPVENGALWADCAACAPGFGAVIASLRRHHRVAVQFPDGAAAEFSLLGSADALGACLRAARAEAEDGTTAEARQAEAAE